jgi:hypothetical protein
MNTNTVETTARNFGEQERRRPFILELQDANSDKWNAVHLKNTTFPPKQEKMQGETQGFKLSMLKAGEEYWQGSDKENRAANAALQKKALVEKVKNYKESELKLNRSSVFGAHEEASDGKERIQLGQFNSLLRGPKPTLAKKGKRTNNIYIINTSKELQRSVQFRGLTINITIKNSN